MSWCDSGMVRQGKVRLSRKGPTRLGVDRRGRVRRLWRGPDRRCGAVRGAA